MKFRYCLMLFTLLASLFLSADEFDLLRNQYLKTRDFTVNDHAAEAWLKQEKPDGSFRNVNYADTDGGRWDLRRHWLGLNTIARSYCFGGKEFKHNPALRDAVIRGIENWARHKYRNHNWWYQAIGIPLMSSETFLLMWDAIPPEVAQRFRTVFDRSKIDMTAQNRLHLAMILLLKGIIYRDDRMVREGREVILSEVAFAPSGKEGLQADFSFHQHGPQMQFGNYGLAFLDSAATCSGLLRGTGYAFPPEKRKLLSDYFLNGMRWVLYRNLFDFSACGRQIVGDGRSEKFRTARSAMLEKMDYSSIGTEKAVRSFFRDTTALEGNRLFFRSDFLVHRRRGLYFSVKMCSGRVIGCESCNRENQLGVDIASGVTQFVRTGDEYLTIMPLWNWRRLPGLTAIQDQSDLTPPDCRPFFRNRAIGVGGVSDGRNGAAMFDYRTGSLSAHKSYLCFDRYVAAIGSGIAAGSDAPVMTTVDSLRLSGDVFADGKKLGMKNYRLSKISTVRHGDFTYRFPVPTNLEIELAEKSADWTAIQPSYRKPGVTARLLTVSIPHGVRPKNAGYCYLLASEKVDTGHFHRLVPDNPAIHAGYDDKAKLGFALFYQPGSVTFPGFGTIELSTPGAVMIRDGKLHFADPSQTLGEIRFQINGKEWSIRLPQGDDAGKSVAFRTLNSPENRRFP